MPIPDRLLEPLLQMTAPHGLLAWAANYLLYSTLLLGAAWAASRLLGGRSLRLEEHLWKAALVGALCAATLQTGLAALPEVPGTSAEVPGTAVATALPEVSGTPIGTVARPASSALPEVPGTSVGHPGLGRLSALVPGWQRLALGAWAFGALLMVTSLAWRWTRLRLRLRRRRDVDAGTPRRLLDRLLARTASRRRVRLTGSPALPVPVALGVGEQEICLPDRALRELDDRRQEGLLAHELAHLERRDPAWLLLAMAIESVLFFQPLNRLARRRLEEIAELECDSWAVRATGDRLGLARCLTQVAGWLVEGRYAPNAANAPGAAAMARSRGQLGVRVRRILAGDPENGEPDAAGASRRWLPVATAATLLALALAVPGLAPSSLAAPAPVQDDDRQVASGAEGIAQEDERSAEREHELRAHREADAGLEEEPELRSDDHRDHDRDWDLDVAHGLDSAEIARLTAEALAAARAGLLDELELADLSEEIEDAISEVMESMPEMMEAQRMAIAELDQALAEMEHDLEIEGEKLSPEERERLRREIERELAAAQEEIRRAMQEVRPQLEALQDVQRDIELGVRREMERAHQELERAEREVRRESVERREIRRDAEREVRTAREQVEREVAEARRELERARQELERERRQLELERRQLEEEKRRIEELREETPEPPAS